MLNGLPFLESHILTYVGMKTTPKMPEPTRSDCHAWSANPLFHYFATILGVRPASPGFRTVEIRPLLGSLEYARDHLPHPRGQIAVSFQRVNGGMQAEIALPEGATGVLRWNGSDYLLTEGSTDLLLLD